MSIDEKIESRVLHRLIYHLQENTEVQNIDLMDLSGFCRNCIAKWYKEASLENGITIDYEKAKEFVYGMPHDEWKKKYQK